jgi:hypothetical protein
MLKGRIETKAFVKSHYVYLYIPAKSAHLNGCLNGRTYGNILRYWIQNSHIKDYHQLVSAFAIHAWSEGRNTDKVDHIIFLEAISHIEDENNNNTAKTTKTTKTHLLHQ